MRSTPKFDAFARRVFDAFPSRSVAVIISYSGSGDSGWFDGTFAVEIDKTVYYPHDDAPPKSIQSALWEVSMSFDAGGTHDELMMIIEERQPGWEINDGGSGEFRIYSDGTREHTHHTYIMQSEITREVF